MLTSDLLRRGLYATAVMVAAAAVISIPVADRAQTETPIVRPSALAVVVHYDAVSNPFAIDPAVAPTPAPTVTPTPGPHTNDPNVPGIGGVGPDGKRAVPGEILAVTIAPDGSAEAQVRMAGSQTPITVHVGMKIGKAVVKRVLIDEVTLSDGVILRPTTGDYSLESTSLQAVPGSQQPPAQAPGNGIVVPGLLPGAQLPNGMGLPNIIPLPTGDATAPTTAPMVVLPLGGGASVTGPQAPTAPGNVPLPQFFPATPSPSAKP